MRVIMLGHKRIPGRDSGVEIVVEQLCARLTRAGHAVTVYNRYRAGKANAQDACGAKVITIPTVNRKSLDAVVYVFLASLRAAFSRCDIVHVHTEGACFMLWLFALARKRVVVTIHGLDWMRAKWGGFASRFIRFGEKIAARYADEIIVLSESARAYFEHAYNRGTVCLPNGAPPARRVCDRVLRERWGVSKDKYLLYLGRIVPEKGVDVLIRAYLDIRTDKKLVIAGAGGHTDAYVRSLRAMAQADPRIVFTGFVEGDALDALYANAYLYVLPSALEGMSISLLEAMAHGCCCLVSDIAENAETSRGCARYFRAGDEADLRARIRELLDSPNDARALGEKGASYVNARLNWDDIARDTLRIYERAIAKKRA